MPNWCLTKVCRFSRRVSPTDNYLYGTLVSYVHAIISFLMLMIRMAFDLFLTSLGREFDILCFLFSGLAFYFCFFLGALRLKELGCDPVFHPDLFFWWCMGYCIYGKGIMYVKMVGLFIFIRFRWAFGLFSFHVYYIWSIYAQL